MPCASRLEQYLAKSKEMKSSCHDLEEMIKVIRSKKDDSLITRFGCACCRRIWHLLSDPRSRAAVEVTENYLNGSASLSDLEAAVTAARLARADIRRPVRNNSNVAERSPESAAAWAAGAVATVVVGNGEAAAGYAAKAQAAVGSGSLEDDYAAERQAQWELLKNLVGNSYSLPSEGYTTE